MKGFLHRLAARASGSGAQVRSNARLPFGADTLPWAQGAAEPGFAEMAEDVRADAAVVPRAGLAPARTSSPMEREIAGKALERAATDPADSAQVPRETPLRTEDAPMPSSAAPPFAAHAGEQRVRTVSGQREAPTTARVSSMEADVPQVRSAAYPEAQEPVLRRSEAPALHPTEGNPAPARELQVRPSSPILAGTEVHDSERLSMPARLPSPLLAQVAARSEEATEVHVHIGRIEVRAVHEAPKQRTRPERSRAVSLEAYLDGKQRR